VPNPKLTVATVLVLDTPTRCKLFTIVPVLNCVFTPDELLTNQVTVSIVA
jgi:hypothetical protein